VIRRSRDGSHKSRLGFIGAINLGKGTEMTDRGDIAVGARIFPSGRFGYSMGYRSRGAALDALDSMCAEGEISACETRLERYNVSGTPHKIIARWAITVE
jgi:hypothetical protein